jgi:dipeptidase E
MPVVEPDSFSAFNLIPFQINPHYLDVNPAGHAGETREQRIEEYIEVNQNVYVVGLREGTMLIVNNKKIHLVGPRSAKIFKKGSPPLECGAGDDLSFLLI